jgi:hypothetical protein
MAHEGENNHELLTKLEEAIEGLKVKGTECEVLKEKLESA